jgi:hypothetical protein
MEADGADQAVAGVITASELSWTAPFTGHFRKLIRPGCRMWVLKATPCEFKQGDQSLTSAQIDVGAEILYFGNNTRTSSVSNLARCRYARMLPYGTVLRFLWHIAFFGIAT